MSPASDPTPSIHAAAGSETRPLLSDNHENQVQDAAAAARAALEELSLSSELGILFRYSGPLIFTYLLQYVYQLVVVLVASQLSTDELAGVSLGVTTSNILGYAVFEGCATALDTLCSQAYGAGRLADVGLFTIRFAIFIHLVAIPIALLWLFSERLLVLVHVPSQVLAEHAGSFLRYSLIGLPGYATFEAGKRFMQAQGNFTAGFWVLLICLPINIGLTYSLVVPANMPVAGAALAASITNDLRPVLLAGYALFVRRSTLQCWPSLQKLRVGWNKDWKPMIKLSVPGALMTVSEWLCFEMLTFGTSYVGTASLAAQTFLSTTATLVWHIPFSASIAASTRIGTLIGARRMSSALYLMKWYAFVFVAIGLIDCALGTGIVCLMLRYLVQDQHVVDLVKITVPFMSLFVICDASSNWPHSIVRGFGYQSLGAWVTMVLNYLYAVPLSIFLELGPPRLGIRGLWIGLASGLALITAVEASILWLKLKRYKAEHLWRLGNNEYADENEYNELQLPESTFS